MSNELIIFISAYLLLISAITVIITVADKIKAGNGSFRIPEKTLFVLAFLGGSLAEYITMKLIRHKTLHKRFMLGLPFIMFFQLGLVFFLLYTLYST